MKRVLSGLLVLWLLVSLGIVSAGAELPEGISFTPGAYSSDAYDFCPAGQFAITWDPDAASKLDLTDGDVADWAEAGYNMITIDASNMVSWVGDPPANWSISAFYVADATWFYTGFFVTDPEFIYGNENTYFNGDAFQVSIDFGGVVGDIINTNPEDIMNPTNIFYSFSCAEDGAPIRIMRQNSDNDGWLSVENGDGVKGAARKTAYGWSVEFALSWQQLYDDYAWKTGLDDPRIHVGGDENRPLKIGCCLYYLDYSETDSNNINWAAGTTNGITDDDGVPQVSWTVCDNGLQLYLECEDGMTLVCDGIEILEKTVTTAETLPETEAPPETAVVTEPEPEPEPETIPPADFESATPSIQSVIFYTDSNRVQNRGVHLAGILMFMVAASVVVVAIACKKKL